jgi:hypothetical protein
MLVTEEISSIIYISSSIGIILVVGLTILSESKIQ